MTINEIVAGYLCITALCAVGCCFHAGWTGNDDLIGLAPLSFFWPVFVAVSAMALPLFLAHAAGRALSRRIRYPQ